MTMQRRQFLRAGSGLLLLDPWARLHAAWAAGRTLAAPGIQTLQGEISIDGQPARIGQLVETGSTIRTGANSSAIYVIGDDAYLQRDHSVVSILGEATRRGLRILNGKLLSVFGKGDKQILTSTATIGIRGTGCYIESDSNRVYFCLCYGAATIQMHRDPTHIEEIKSLHHDHPLYLDPDGQLMMVPATVYNHTDDELYLLENLVGRLPAFAGKISGKRRY